MALNQSAISNTESGTQPPAHSEAPRPSTNQELNINHFERWASLAAGCVLTTFGLTRGRWSRIVYPLIGAGLIYRGLRGYCPVYDAMSVNSARQEQAQQPHLLHDRGVKVVESIIVRKPVEELYRFWRNLENLPRFMGHLKSVTAQDHTHSHWVAKAPLGVRVEWDAEIINEKENQLIAWRSLETTDVIHAGSVRFEPLPGGQGTFIKVTLEYAPPGGRLGAAVAKLFGEEPQQQVQDDLRRFKEVMESNSNLLAADSELKS